MISVYLSNSPFPGWGAPARGFGERGSEPKPLKKQPPYLGERHEPEERAGDRSHLEFQGSRNDG